MYSYERRVYVMVASSSEIFLYIVKRLAIVLDRALEMAYSSHAVFNYESDLKDPGIRQGFLFFPLRKQQKPHNNGLKFKNRAAQMVKNRAVLNTLPPSP